MFAGPQGSEEGGVKRGVFDLPVSRRFSFESPAVAFKLPCHRVHGD
jgi:hypothetical protein